MFQEEKHIEINIGKACNNKCLFCMSSKPSLWDIKFTDVVLVDQKLKDYSEQGYTSVGFLGGDISIHPKILDIVKLCKKYHFKIVNVITNGMRFDNIDFAREIISSGVTRVNISIHSHIDSIENTLTKVTGGLQRKLHAIDNLNLLRREGILLENLSINIVLNNYNYETIVETVLYFFRIKQITDIRINFLRLEEHTKENWGQLDITYTQILPYIKKLIYISLKYHIRITFDAIPACIFYQIDSVNYAPLISKFLGEDQDHIVEIDHINRGDKFDWKARKKNELKTQFRFCRKCVYTHSCQGVWKTYVECHGKKEFAPITQP